MAYGDGLAVLRIYTTRDLSSSAATVDDLRVRMYTGARAIYDPGYVVDAPVAQFPTFTETTNISLLPYNDDIREAFIEAGWATTVSEFKAAGFTVGEDADGWYLELPFEPVGADGLTFVVNPADPSNFSPVYTRMRGFDLTKVWVGAAFSGGVYELGQRDIIEDYSEPDYVPIELYPAEVPFEPPPPFWTAFNNTREVGL